jgi:hypothetical protein
MKQILLFLILVAAATASFAQSQPGDINGRGLSFIPDYTFKGSSSKGWKSLGTTDWTARDGELTGKAKSGTEGGWLMLDRSFQDITVNTLVKISADAEAGILFRAESTDDGIKGVLLSIKNGELSLYSILLDQSGKELKRDYLRPAGGMIRLAPPADANAPAPGKPNNQARQNRSVSGPVLPIARPKNEYVPGQWNQIEVVLDLNIMRSFLNDGNGPGGAADEIMGKSGPIALYSGGNGEVQFKDFKYKDLALRFTPKEKTSPRFEAQQVSDMYYSWSAAAEDFNKDGYLDVVAGPYIYYGPEYTKFSEIYMGVAFITTK